jgi:hypothetical protein
MLMKRIVAVLLLCLIMIGCEPIERQAYHVFVGAKAFLDAEKKMHPECSTESTTLCHDLAQATRAKDALIDAAEVWCAGPEFEAGGKCQAPKKGTPAYDQGIAKLKAAIEIYAQAEADLKGALK